MFVPVISSRAVLLGGACAVAGGILLSRSNLHCTADAPVVDTTVKSRKLSLMQEALGPEAFGTLPALLQRVNQLSADGTSLTLTGTVEVSGPPGGLPFLIRKIVGLPEPMQAAPFEMSIQHNEDGSESWVRSFASKPFCNTVHSTKVSGQIEERPVFPLSFVHVFLAPSVTPSGLLLSTAGLKLSLVPIPQFLCPKAWALESVDSNGRFVFELSLDLPFLGHVIAYKAIATPTD